MVSVDGVGNAAANIGIIAVVIVFFIVLAGLMIFLMSQYKKWSQFTCVIWGKDGFGQVIESTDKAGIFVDRKTKNKRFFLRKGKVGLECNNVPYIQKGRTKVVYLLRTGLKNFTFIKPSIDDSMMRFDVGEEDVNWAINAYEKQKRLFNQNVLMQYMPFIMIGFVTIVIMIIFIYFFKQFPVLKATAEAFRDAATAFAQSQSGTVVLS